MDDYVVGICRVTLLITPLVSVELPLLVTPLVSSTFRIGHHCINFHYMYNVMNYCHCQNNHFLLIDNEQYNMFNRSDKCLALVWEFLKTLIMHLIILESYSCNCISFIDQHHCRYVVSNNIVLIHGGRWGRLFVVNQDKSIIFDM